MAGFGKLDVQIVEFNNKISARELDELVLDPKVKRLQCSRPIKAKKWALLNDRFFSRRPDVWLRVLHHPYDLSFVAEMDNVRNFAADSLGTAEGVENVARMENLERLGIGIWELESLDFLNAVTEGLKGLILGQTKSRKPDLAVLSRFKDLETVYIEGHRKNIEVLSELTNLMDVTLRSITTPNISYLRPLERMWSLDIKLGGIKDLYAIEGMENIKYLELWMIKGLTDIGFISGLYGLQNLFLQALRRVKCLPDMVRLKKLKRICLWDMKGLEDVNSLEHAPALEEFALACSQGIQPEDYLPVLRNKSLKRACAGLGSLKKNRKFEELCSEFNIEEYHFSKFGTFEYE